MVLRALAIVVTFFAVVEAAQARDAFRGHSWVTHTNDRFGFSLRYPADVFEPERSSEAGDGEVFVGIRGHGRLLVGAFENRDRHSVESYMNFIRRESYSNYVVSYAPRGQTWFVLSGEDNANIFYEKVFYEKVMFSCQGRMINSFALIYPIESKLQFDPIVEGIEKTFRPGQDCGLYARE